MEKGKQKHTPKYAQIEWTNLDYRRLPPIPDSFCDRQAKDIRLKIKEKKEEWKKCVVIYEMLEKKSKSLLDYQKNKKKYLKVLFITIPSISSQGFLYDCRYRSCAK